MNFHRDPCEIEAEYDLGLALLQFLPEQRTKLTSLLADWAASLGQPINDSCFENLCKELPQPQFVLPDIVDFAGADRFMAALKKRGHHRHQFETFLLGLNIIKHICPDTSSLVDNPFGETSLDIVKNWLSTAIGHDYGYPVQEASSLLQEFSSLFGRFGFESLEKGIEQAILTPLEISKSVTEYKTTDSSRDLQPFLKEAIRISIDETKIKLEQNCIVDNLVSLLLVQPTTASDRMTINHGYASALCFLRHFFIDYDSRHSLSNVTSLDPYQDPSMISVLRIAGAMALHALKHNEGQTFSPPSAISCQKNPYAYLLYLVDNIQDWGRTLFMSERYPDYHLTNIAHDDKDFSLKIKPHHENWDDEVIRNTENHLEEISLTLSKLHPFNNDHRIIITYDGIPTKSSPFVIVHNI